LDFLIAIPLINAINYYLTYYHFHFNLFLLLTFTIDTVQEYYRRVLFIIKKTDLIKKKYFKSYKYLI